MFRPMNDVPPIDVSNLTTERRTAALPRSAHGYGHRVHRVATAAFWHTFHHEGKISPGLVRVGGERPLPFITFTIASKVAAYAPAEWAVTLTLFHLS
jgi:hypothetical protein